MSKYLLFAVFVLLAALAFVMLAYLIKHKPKKDKVTTNDEIDEIDEKLFETINLSINDINEASNNETVNSGEPIYDKDDIIYTEDNKPEEQKDVDEKPIEIEINSANS